MFLEELLKSLLPQRILLHLLGQLAFCQSGSVDPDPQVSTNPHIHEFPAEEAFVNLVKGIGEVKEDGVNIVTILQAPQDVLIVIEELGQAAPPLPEPVLLVGQGQGCFKEVLKLLFNHALKCLDQV